jgi:hypothetical protein
LVKFSLLSCLPLLCFPLGGCSDKPVGVWDCQATHASLDMASTSQLGFSGNELREAAVGNYDMMAVGPDGGSFKLLLTVESAAVNADEQVHTGADQGAGCRTRLRIAAHFRVTSDTADLQGEWDGVLDGTPDGAPSGIGVWGEAAMARAAFEHLPSASKAAKFSFGSSLGSDAARVQGMISEVIEPVDDGEQHPTGSPLILASWGDP